MSTYDYRQILDQIQRLTPDEMRQLQRELEILIRLQEKPKPEHHVRELRGAGKETLKGINVQEYIDRERNSWDG